MKSSTQRELWTQNHQTLNAVVTLATDYNTAAFGYRINTENSKDITGQYIHSKTQNTGDAEPMDLGMIQGKKNIHYQKSKIIKNRIRVITTINTTRGVTCITIIAIRIDIYQKNVRNFITHLKILKIVTMPPIILNWHKSSDLRLTQKDCFNSMRP